MAKQMVKDLEKYLDGKTGVGYDDREKWRLAIDEQSRLRGEAKTEREREEHGKEMLRLFNVGPRGYMLELKGKKS